MPKRDGHMKIEFLDSGREPQCPPDPHFPKGKYVDLSSGAAASCETKLPYPAPRCGAMVITCDKCKQRVVVTVAGRPDDPHTVRLACRLGATGEFPRGKHREDDEGGLRIAIYERDHTIVIEFGKSITWLGMSKAEAIEFAKTLIAKASGPPIVKK